MAIASHGTRCNSSFLSFFEKLQMQHHYHKSNEGMAEIHGHSHAHGAFDRAFSIGVVLNLGFVLIEVVFGLTSNSLALLADAGHNLSDVLGLLLAWGASALVRRRPTRRHTYGLRRTTVLAALFNSLLLLVAVAAIVWEAFARFRHPEMVASEVVMLVAAVGVVINGFTAWLFAAGRHKDLNIRGAYLHMAADAAVSLGVIFAAVAMRYTGWWWLDPATSIAIALVIGVGTWSLLRESINLVLDGVPDHVQMGKVEAYLASLPGVKEVHDLHVWAMSTTEFALTAHLVKPDGLLDDGLLARINEDLKHEFNIQHMTVQLESGDKNNPCKQAPVEVV